MFYFLTLLFVLFFAIQFILQKYIHLKYYIQNKSKKIMHSQFRADSGLSSLELDGDLEGNDSDLEVLQSKRSMAQNLD